MKFEVMTSTGERPPPTDELPTILATEHRSSDEHSNEKTDEQEPKVQDGEETEKPGGFGDFWVESVLTLSPDRLN